MQFIRTRATQDALKGAVSSAQGDISFLKTCFTGYLLVVFHTEAEEIISAIIKERLLAGADQPTASFIENTISSITSRVKKTDLAEIASYFSTECKDKFNQPLADVDVTLYGNFVLNRHKVAHPSQGLTVSWEETTNICEIGERVIAAFKAAIT